MVTTGLILLNGAVNLVFLGLIGILCRRIRVESKQRFDMVQETADHYRNIMDSVVDGIITIDGAYTVLSANRSAERMFRFPPGALGNVDVSSLFVANGQGPFCALLRDIHGASDDGVIPYELTGMRRDGSCFPLEIRVGNAVVDHRPVTVCIVRDLTERVKVERQLRKAYERDRKELEAAAEMQKHLLPPPAAICGIRFDWLYTPCRYVAGDIFNYFRLDEKRLGFYLIDVAGHGPAAAMLSFTLSTVLSPKGAPLRRLMLGPPGYVIVPPAEVVEELNRSFQTGNDAAGYFTMIYGIIDLEQDTISLTQAGHPPPFLLDRDGTAREAGRGGFPVGLLADVTYDEIELTFLPGNRLVLYSDGVTEVANGNGELFASDRLQRVLSNCAGVKLAEMLVKIDENLDCWRGESAFEDDITVLAIEREG